MQSFQTIYTAENGWQPALEDCQLTQPHLLFVSGDCQLFKDQKPALMQAFEHAELVGASSSISINDDILIEDGLVATVLQFKQSNAEVLACDCADAFYEQYGYWLKQLPEPKMVILLGTESLRLRSNFIKRVAEKTDAAISLAGALASDGSQLFHRKDLPEEAVIALAICGEQVTSALGSFGGWDAFGREYEVTKSEKNLLIELDNQPALSIYQQVLGDKGADVFTDSERYPMSLRHEDNAFGYMRAVTNIDEYTGSIELGGPIEQDSYVRFCKSGVSHILDGATGAATQCMQQLSHEPDLCFIFSSVRRKQVLNDRLHEEVEIVRDHLGEKPTFVGFYSFGTFAPLFQSRTYHLHNQTMLVLAIDEKG